MPFSAMWCDLLNNVEKLPSDTTLYTPMSCKPFCVTGTQEDRILIEYRDGEEPTSLQRDRFETLVQRVEDAREGFDLSRLPPETRPYATLLSLHSQFELDDNGAALRETDTPTNSALVDVHKVDGEKVQREDPDPTIEEMMDNMADPENDVVCPIEGCEYSHRSAASVARHVSGSSTAKHIWANTSYAGWRDFVREHGESPG